MSIIYRKVGRDLLRNKTRTLLVVLSTAVGVLALGIAVGGGDLLDTYITSEWQSFQPAHIVLSLNGAVGDDTATAFARAPGVGGVEPMIGSSIRWKLPGETQWRPGNLIARQDYERQQQSLVRLSNGTWPGTKRGGTLAAERGTAEEFNLPLGSEIILQVGNTERKMRITGVVHDLGTLPPKSDGQPEFFAASQTMQDLLGLNGYNQLLVRLPQFDRDRAYAVGDQLKERLERMGLTVSTPFVQDPTKHFVVTQYTEPIMVILTVLGILSLGLSAFLVINTINAVLAQQVSQIGVMKAVGATPGQVMRVYLVMTLAYGLMATCMAVIPTPFLARALIGTMLSMANMDLPSFQIVPGAIILQLAVGLLVPVVAALWSVLSAARITVRQAISSYGLGTDFGGGPLDQLVAHIRGLPRPLAISLRNTFRRKGRMALTQITLVIAGVTFISVMGVRDSLVYTIERFLASRGFSVYFVFQDPQRFERAEAMAKSVPGVTRAELWDVRPVTFDLGDHRLNVSFWAAPEDTTMFKPEIVAGRWLRPGDGNVMVLNQKIAADEGLKVGDRVTLKLERGDSTWEIVGLVMDISNEQLTAYASREAFGRALHQFGRGTRLNVTADQNDLASLTEIEKQLRATLESSSMAINDSGNIEQIRQRNMNQFGVVIYLLLAMSVLAGVVGGFGLMGTMSINVLERSKEIGVMRAIGASSSTLVGIFVVEGVIVGLLSAAMAIPFSFPGAWLFAEAVGKAMLIKMDFAYSAVGLLLWLLIVVALSSLASLWPAMRAAQVSVRETLAYE